MYNNGERATPEKEGQAKEAKDHDVKAFVTPLRDSETPTKGLGTVQIGEMLKINGIRVNENTKEGSENFGKLFVAMPSRPDKAAESGYRDIVHPVNKDFGDKLRAAVLDKFDDQLAWQKNKDAKEKAAQREKPSPNKSEHDDR